MQFNRFNTLNVESIHWLDREGRSHYPSKSEFRRIVERKILFTYNLTLPIAKVIKYVII